MTCEKCGRCCERYPCAFTPNDIMKLSKYLKMSVKKMLEEYFTIDYYITDENKYYLLPKRNCDKKGLNIVSYDWAFGGEPCIFLMDDKLCKIHECKSENAKMSFCKMPAPDTKYTKTGIWKMWEKYFDNYELNIEKLENEVI